MKQEWDEMMIFKGEFRNGKWIITPEYDAGGPILQPLAVIVCHIKSPSPRKLRNGLILVGARDCLNGLQTDEMHEAANFLAKVYGDNARWVRMLSCFLNVKNKRKEFMKIGVQVNANQNEVEVICWEPGQEYDFAYQYVYRLVIDRTRRHVECYVNGNIMPIYQPLIFAPNQKA